MTDNMYSSYNHIYDYIHKLNVIKLVIPLNISLQGRFIIVKLQPLFIHQKQRFITQKYQLVVYELDFLQS